MLTKTMHLSPRLLQAAMLASLLFVHADAFAHGDDKKKPPTKARADLVMARKQMDAAKQKLIQAGRYACSAAGPAKRERRSRDDRQTQHQRRLRQSYR